MSYAKWEEHQGQKAYARQVFERALRDLTRDDITQRLYPFFTNITSSRYIEFGKFEIRCHELERARVIFKYGLDNLEPEKAKELYSFFPTLIGLEKRNIIHSRSNMEAMKRSIPLLPRSVVSSMRRLFSRILTTMIFGLIIFDWKKIMVIFRRFVMSMNAVLLMYHLLKRRNTGDGIVVCSLLYE